MTNINEEIEKFRIERDWKKFHNEKDLAISISIESNELLELFQWKDSHEVVENNIEGIKEELADILIYSYMLANNLNLDINAIIKNKLEINRGKYPIEKSFGNNKKYNDFLKEGNE